MVVFFFLVVVVGLCTAAWASAARGASWKLFRNYFSEFFGTSGGFGNTFGFVHHGFALSALLFHLFASVVFVVTFPRLWILMKLWTKFAIC